VIRVVRFERDVSIEMLLTALPPSAPSASSTTEHVAKSPKWGGKQRTQAAPKAAGNCDPPFYFENGIKVYKPGCL